MSASPRTSKGTKSPARQGRGERRADRRNTADADLDLMQHLQSLTSRFRDSRDAEKPLRAALRTSLELFDAAEGCVAVLAPGGGDVDIMFSVPRESRWDRYVLAGFLQGAKAPVAPDEMLARIRRRDRLWGALIVRSSGAEFDWVARRRLSSIGTALGELVDRIDQERIRDVRSRIDRKILEQIRPKDLFYQILRGLRSLTEYDHSASLLIANDDVDALEVVAEQIAWRKGKSDNIGLKVPLTEVLRTLLAEGAVYGFDRDGAAWQEWDGRPATALAEAMDYNRSGDGHDDDDEVRREATMLCAPLASRDGVLGVMKIAATNGGTFGQYESELIRRFLPHASVALQNSQRAETLEAKVLAAERKHAMADLARGVSHDVNNALGAVLPLVQELRADVRTGDLDPDVAAADLAEIERSVQMCRRIFGGMLRFARGAAQRSGEVHPGQEVKCTLDILRDSIERRQIAVTVDVPADLPHIKGVQADVEQLLLNLLTNARDAMPTGGRLAIRGRHRDGMIELRIEDTGCGISAADMSKIREPFFTTKASGSGLGLAICRSIVAQMGGSLDITSTPGEGTCVTVLMNALRDDDR